MPSLMAVSILQDPTIIAFCGTMVIGLFSTIVGAIIWFVRLEGKQSYEYKAVDTRLSALTETVKLAHSRIDDTKAKHEEMETRLFQKMSSIEVSLADISGYLRKQGERV